MVQRGDHSSFWRQGTLIGTLARVWAAACLALAGCASTVTDYPVVPQTQIEAIALVDQQASVTARLDRKARVDAIAWPLLAGNVGLCFERTVERFGFTIGNDRFVRDLADGFTLKQVRALGYDGSPLVMNVAVGSPADRAGMVRGSVPVRIGDTEINGDMKALNEALAAYRKARTAANEAINSGAVDGGQPAAFAAVFRQPDGTELPVQMQPQNVCDIPVNVRERDIVNASAGGREINMFRGLLARMDDDELAIVMSHEIGHVIGQHVRKQQRNSYVSGFALWGVPVGIGAGLFDSVFARPLERWGGVETPPGQTGVTRLANGILGTREFEREADYLGMYIAARGGVDISDAESVFQEFAKLSPASTYGERTHPVTGDRQLALGLARDEIRAKQAAGELLIPNDWPYPVSLSGDD